MSKITFHSKRETSKTVNNLLDSVLPGHSSSTSSLESSISSTSQVINASQKRMKPEEVRRLKKRQKLEQRHAIRKEKTDREHLDSLARYQVLKQHSKVGKLTKVEQIELKRLVKKNVVNLQSWRTDVDDDLEEIQREILDLKKTDYVRTKRRDVGKKAVMKDLYKKKKQQQRYPGLTPGLAPVDMNDSDSDDE